MKWLKRLFRRYHKPPLLPLPQRQARRDYCREMVGVRS